VAFCQEQARCLFHKESVFCSCLQSSRTGKMPVPQRVSFLGGWAGDPVPAGAQKPGFLRNTSLHRVNLEKNPVSLSECVQDCLNPDKYKELGKLD